MELDFAGEIFHWRGPSPFHFVAVPDDPSAAIEAVASMVTSGWGVIPVEVRTTLGSVPVSTWPLLQSAPSKVDASVQVHGFLAQDIHHSSIGF